MLSVKELHSAVVSIKELYRFGTHSQSCRNMHCDLMKECNHF